KRLGADTRSTACVSSNASGTKGRIQALICCGGRSCSSRWTQVCQKSFMSTTSVNLDSTLLAPKLSTGKTGRTLGIYAKHLTKHQKFDEMAGCTPNFQYQNQPHAVNGGWFWQ